MLGRICSRAWLTRAQVQLQGVLGVQGVQGLQGVLASRGIKQKVKVEFIRPEYPGARHPLVSGDKSPADLPDLSEPRTEFLSLSEFQDIPEDIKPIFSIGYYNSKRASEIYITKMEDLVRRHAYDDSSVEVKVARYTARIRVLQRYMEKHPRNHTTAIFLKELIDRRNKFIRTLRRRDYKLYEYVLEKLDLEYKPEPDENQKPTRKKSTVKLVELQCEEIKKKKMEEYKQSLIQEKEKLLKEFTRNPI